MESGTISRLCLATLAPVWPRPYCSPQQHSGGFLAGSPEWKHKIEQAEITDEDSHRGAYSWFLSRQCTCVPVLLPIFPAAIPIQDPLKPEVRTRHRTSKMADNSVFSSRHLGRPKSRISVLEQCRWGYHPRTPVPARGKLRYQSHWPSRLWPADTQSATGFSCEWPLSVFVQRDRVAW